MGFLDGILGALGDFASVIGQVIAYIFQLVVTIAQFLWQVLQLVAQYILTGLKAVGNFFHHIWDAFFKGIFTHIFNGIIKGVHWLEAHLKPAIDFLKKAQKYIDRIYNRYIRPFITLLQRVRRFLSILRLLHIKWAQKLDQILATVQHDVQGAFLLLRGVLNTAIDILNIIADPTKLLRHPTLILSIRRSLMAIIRQTTHLPPGFFIPSLSSGAPRGLGKMPLAFDASNPDQNPPASYYLGLDYGVPSFDFLGPGETIGDGAVDDVGALGFFSDNLLDIVNCSDPEQCLDDAIQTLKEEHANA